MNAILIGVTTKFDKYNIDYSLNELENLANTLNYNVIYKMSQKLDKPNPKTYIGSGKINEILTFIKFNEVDVVIFNDELSASMLRNLTEILNIEIIDRTYLILKIFELRQSNRQSMLEIKLAKDIYLLPRVQYLREKQDRIGGKGQTKGSGETQKELDKRYLLNEINKITKELENIKKMKERQIQKRKENDIPIVALAGYTNAGKSTTLNTILEYINKSDKAVLSKNQLFSTLDTSTRLIEYNKIKFLLTDTIGFISKLPHNLINSFYQTLQEIKYADLIIHVIDSSSDYINEELNVVMDVLYSICDKSIPIIFLLNKWDKTKDDSMQVYGYKSIRFSNIYKNNIDELLNAIIEEISPVFINIKILLPYKNGNLIKIIEEKGLINNKEYKDNGTYFDVEIPKKLYHLFKEFDLDIA